MGRRVARGELRTAGERDGRRSTVIPRRIYAARFRCDRGATGSVTVVRPAAYNPANSAHVFTCALGTGDVIDGMQRRARNLERRKLVFARADAGAQLSERLHDALHGPPRERLIAEDAARERLGAKDAR